MASCVDMGPGSTFAAATPSSNSWADIHRRSSIQRWRRRATWVGGPPNPTQPILPHSRTMVRRDTLGRDGTDRFCHRRLARPSPLHFHPTAVAIVSGAMRAMQSLRGLILGVLVLGAATALDPRAGATPGLAHPQRPATRTSGGATTSMRALSAPLYGVTVDNVANLGNIVAGSRTLGHMPTTRIYFNVKQRAANYEDAVKEIQPVSYIMGELLDSSESRRISTASYDKRVKSYVSTLGIWVDVWEIGNEVNGNWTGRYSTVEAKLADAYHDVASVGKRSALTLYYNVGCGDGPKELDPISFTQKYVPAAVRSGLNYVLLSYYEGDCKGIRPSAATWTAYFARLHGLYPSAQLGFGEVGMDKPTTTDTLGAAQSIMDYYYGLGIDLPYYVGGYFWWYYDEDCLPPTTKPLWNTLQTAFISETTAFSP